MSEIGNSEMNIRWLVLWLFNDTLPTHKYLSNLKPNIYIYIFNDLLSTQKYLSILKPIKCVCVCVYIYIYIYIYRVSQEECEILRESVSYVKLHRYIPKHLYPKLNGYGDNGQRKVWTSCISAYCTSTAVAY